LSKPTIRHPLGNLVICLSCLSVRPSVLQLTPTPLLSHSSVIHTLIQTILCNPAIHSSSSSCALVACGSLTSTFTLPITHFPTYPIVFTASSTSFVRRTTTRGLPLISPSVSAPSLALCWPTRRSLISSRVSSRDRSRRALFGPQSVPPQSLWACCPSIPPGDSPLPPSLFSGVRLSRDVSYRVHAQNEQPGIPLVNRFPLTHRRRQGVHNSPFLSLSLSPLAHNNHFPASPSTRRRACIAASNLDRRAPCAQASDV
jgi:hypothetical protein